MSGLNKKPLWDNEHVQFPRLLAEIFALLEPSDFVSGNHNYKLHLQLHDLCEAMDLPARRILALFKRADKRWEYLKNYHCPPDDEPCECEEGNPFPGVLFPCSAGDSDFVSVERCDMCQRFATDDDAAAELLPKIMDLGYTFSYYLLPDMKWEDPGASHLVLTKVVDMPEGARGLGAQLLVPQTVEQVDELLEELKP